MVIDFKTGKSLGCGVKIRKVQPVQPVQPARKVVSVATLARPVMIFASKEEAATVREGLIAAGLIRPN